MKFTLDNDYYFLRLKDSNAEWKIDKVEKQALL